MVLTHHDVGSYHQIIFITTDKSSTILSTKKADISKVRDLQRKRLKQSTANRLLYNIEYFDTSPPPKKKLIDQLECCFIYHPSYGVKSFFKATNFVTSLPRIELWMQKKKIYIFFFTVFHVVSSYVANKLWTVSLQKHLGCFVCVFGINQTKFCESNKNSSRTCLISNFHIKSMSDPE